MRRLPPIILITTYLAATAYFFTLHVAGDANRHEAGYFWTWDMYPGYETASSRRIVIARTAAGSWLRLLPDGVHRFRLHDETGDRDVDGIPVPRGLARVDLNRGEPFLRRAVAAAVERRRGAAPDQPLTRMAVVDCYWPLKFNLPDDLLERTEGDLAPRGRYYWRVAAEGTVESGGSVHWRRSAAQ